MKLQLKYISLSILIFAVLFFVFFLITKFYQHPILKNFFYPEIRQERKELLEKIYKYNEQISILEKKVDSLVSISNELSKLILEYKDSLSILDSSLHDYKNISLIYVNKSFKDINLVEKEELERYFRNLIRIRKERDK